MANFMGSIVYKRRGLVFEEADIARVLTVVNNRVCGKTIGMMKIDMYVGNCGWADRTKWFVHFNATENQWRKIVDDLKVIRVWGNTNIPKDCVGQVYSTD